MPSVALGPNPREHLPWRDFDRRLFALLSHLATSARGAASIQGIFDEAASRNIDIGDPTDAVDGILRAERAHLHPFAAPPCRYDAVGGTSTRYLR